MSEDKKRGSGVRRVGSKDRKQSLDAPGSLFPPTQPPVGQGPAPQTPPPEKPAPQPSPVKQSDWGEEEERDRADDVRYMPPKAATQEADRFPPIAPQEDRPRLAAPKSASKPKRSLAWQDKVAIFFALATIAMIAYVVLLISDPYTPLNLFAPPTPMPVLITATPGPTLPPTSSPTPTHEPTLTPIPTGTFTPIPADSITSVTFALADAGVIYVANSAERGGCNWSSIAGSVTDHQGQGLEGYGVHISGDGVDDTVFSGTTAAYGPGGFELPLNGAPKQAQYTVQLLSPDNLPVSEAYPVATHDQCDQNIAVVSFVQAG